MFTTNKRYLFSFLLLCIGFNGLQAGISVWLIAGGGREVILPPSAVVYSSVLRNVCGSYFEGKNPYGDDFPTVKYTMHLSTISGETLEDVSSWLMKIDQLAKQDKYVPRAMQPIASKMFDVYNQRELELFIEAIEVLKIKILQNAFAACVVDTYLRENSITGKKLNEVIENVCLILQKKFCSITEDTLCYIGKHFKLRARGINGEFSIADYLDTYEMTSKKFLGNKYLCSFDQRKLTSLFGVERLKSYVPCDENINLDLSNGHCILGNNLDVYFPHDPFKSLNGSLKELHLSQNNCLKLDTSIFGSLDKLDNLSLDYSSLESVLGPGNGFETFKLCALLINENKNNIPERKKKFIENLFPNTMISYNAQLPNKWKI